MDELQAFLATYVYVVNKYKGYKNSTFNIPRIYCKDGFNISIQCSAYHYCESENGIQEYGINWKEVEWGYPSEEIDAKLYKAEILSDESTTNTIGPYVSTELLNNLLQEHGGIDFQTTLSK